MFSLRNTFCFHVRFKHHTGFRWYTSSTPASQTLDACHAPISADIYALCPPATCHNAAHHHSPVPLMRSMPPHLRIIHPHTNTPPPSKHPTPISYHLGRAARASYLNRSSQCCAPTLSLSAPHRSPSSIDDRWGTHSSSNGGRT